MQTYLNCLGSADRVPRSNVSSTKHQPVSVTFGSNIYHCGTPTPKYTRDLEPPPEDDIGTQIMRDSVKNRSSRPTPGNSRAAGFEISKQQPSLYSLTESNFSSTGSFYVASSDEEVTEVGEKGQQNDVKLDPRGMIV